MPGSTTTKKNLYIAKNLTELNAKADSSIKVSDGQCRMYVKSSDKVYQNAEESQLLGDDERAYVLYMKFLNIVQAVRKSAEYKKNKAFYDNMMGSARIAGALKHAEELSGGLKDRYEECEAREVSARLQALDEKAAEKPQEEEVTETTETEEISDNIKPPVEEKSGLVSCEKMYSLMTDGSTSLLLLDIRLPDQFLSSHIKYHSCVNVPKDIVPAGCTVRHIEASLPAESKEAWGKRGSVDFVVLLDWTCTEKDLLTGTPLCSLKDAIFKWDQDMVVRSEPLLLDGGYEEWLNYYPTWTTNALIPRPPSYSQVSGNTISLEKIDYDFDFFKTPEEKAAEERKRLMEQKEQDLSINGRDGQFPMIPDRTKKPTTGPVPNNMIRPNNSVTQIVEKSIERINNDLNNPNNNNRNSQSAWKATDMSKPPISQVKENNLVNERQIKEMKKPQEPVVPDRTLKPSAKTSNTETDAVKPDSVQPSVNAELERRLNNEKSGAGRGVNGPSKGDQDVKEISGGRGGGSEVNQQLERDRQRILLETEARRAKLEAEKEQIEKLKQLKTKEAEETAALMRKKREVEEQLRQLETEKRGKEEEERLRQESSIKRVEEDRGKQAEVVALREKRKAQEAEAQAEKDRLAEEELQEEIKKQEAAKAKDELRKQELARQEVLKREEEERQAREKKLLEEQQRLEETERARRAEMERKIKEEECKLADMKRQQEAEDRKWQQEAKDRKRQQEAKDRKRQQEAEDRKRQQEAEDRKRQQEAEDRKRQQEAARERERKEREEADKKRKEETERRQREQRAAETGASTLPPGWEKRFDKDKSMYYYINHDTKTTQWDPPKVQGGRGSPHVVPKGLSTQGPARAASPQRKPAPGDSYTVRLKEEGEQSAMGGGLKRSHSSPNITKLMESETDGSKLAPLQPSVNRAQKPQPSSTVVDPRQAIKDLQRPKVLSEAKVRNFTPSWGSVGHGLSGLRNQGNTCYMNSTLQCMSNTGFLTTYLITENYRHDINVHNKFGTRGEIAEEYCALVKAMWSGQYKSITPRDFKLSCARHCSTFAGYDQQDSQEFLSYLLDWLHEDLNKIRGRAKLPEQDNDGVPDEVAAERAWKLHKTVHDSIVVDLFQGQFKSTVMCKVCEKRSVTFDTFMFLSLEIPSKSRCSLRDCLMNFSQEEQMTGDSKWNCPQCKVKRNAVKRIVIWKLPPILIIVLKRFCQSGMWRQKNSAYVDFPLDSVDFQKFVSGPQLRKPFNLFAVSNHYGTMDGGHYTAFCKNPKLNRWYKFDDHEVYEYSKSDIKSAAAYFLFYTSIGQM